MGQRCNFSHSFIHLINISYTRNCPGAKGYGDEEDLLLLLGELIALHISRTYGYRTDAHGTV